MAVASCTRPPTSISSSCCRRRPIRRWPGASSNWSACSGTSGWRPATACAPSSNASRRLPAIRQCRRRCSNRDCSRAVSGSSPASARFSLPTSMPAPSCRRGGSNRKTAIAASTTRPTVSRRTARMARGACVTCNSSCGSRRLPVSASLGAISNDTASSPTTRRGCSLVANTSCATCERTSTCTPAVGKTVYCSNIRHRWPRSWAAPAAKRCARANS